MAELTILDADGNEIDLTDENPADFGIIPTGQTSEPIELQVQNTGEENLFFVTLTGITHPTAQVGAASDTAEAIEFSDQEIGDFEDSVTFDRLDAGEAATFYARWAVPLDAAGGALVWAMEAAASTT